MGSPQEADAPIRFAPIVGEAMRILRERREGLSQEKLAQRAGCSRETVRRVEAGIDTTTTTIDALLNAMKYGGDDLLKELQATRAKLNGISQLSPALAVITGRGQSGDGKPTQTPLAVPVR